MKQFIALSALAATLAMPIAAQAQAQAATQAPAQPIKGGQCIEIGDNQFNCNHLGIVKNAREIYEKGFKIIAAFATNGSRYFIIEQQ